LTGHGCWRRGAREMRGEVVVVVVVVVGVADV
jgi:hypothetical protein